MSDNKPAEEISQIPGFPVRWFLLFRYFPDNLFRPGFLFGVLTGRHPVLWDNFMQMERRRRQNLLKIKELEITAAKTKTYPDFQLTKTYNKSRGPDAGIHKYYKSAVGPDEVKSFYVSELQSKGWILDKQMRGRLFRKQRLTIWILPATGGMKWNYVVSYIWREE